MKKLLRFLLSLSKDAYCLLSFANCLLVLSLSKDAYCQLPYWQQQVNYTIDVSLNDKDHSLDGFEKIEYINHSPDTLHYIWFHLWPNAYKNDRTAFSDQFLENGKTDFYFSGKEEKGYINRLDFKVNGTTAQLEDHPQHIDIVKLILPAPLAPGQKINITTPFHVRLPFNVSRGGHDGETYQVTQWYPKPAVYDQKGWHPMPYLDQGEFYSEFGSFDVSITIPENYVVAATGELQDEKEKPLRFRQNNIHDFAWFADKRFTVDQDTCRLASGRIIDVYTYYNPADQIWKNSVVYAKRAIRHYSALVGEYPYNVAKVVEGPESFGGGMEYPTITVISPTKNPKELELTIVHELGHNWFYGILASNERAHPWMDEGINTFYEHKYDSQGYIRQLERILFESKAAIKTDQPIELSSEKYSEANYNLVAYYKTSEWLRYVEEQIGAETFQRAMQEYYRRWQFRHPQPEDFKQVLQEVSGKNMDSYFALLDQTGILPNQEREGTQIAFALSGNAYKEYAKKSPAHLLLVGPAIGVNSYDKFMAGIFITNMKLPPSAFQFFLAPMYATGSKRLAGIGRLQHNFYSNGIFRKIGIGITGSTFSSDQFIDDDNIKTVLGFQKIVPGIRFTFRNKDARSWMNRYVQFKTFFIREDGLRFYRDTVITGIDTTIFSRHRTVQESRVLNQLQFVIENNRALYPYSGQLRIEQGTDFIRTAFTGKYFFNYNKEIGLNVRLFAGKFFYTSARTFNKQFSTSRYHLNMTGPNGYEDYTYSDYFLGRNKFEGLASQQIMIRDGGFKVRTELLAEKVGRTDNWLTAVNLSSDIPAGMNPLSMLPVKIPLKIFLDIGTYAEAWKTGASTDRFLYDAGLHFPLFKETINIYVPVLYSRVYKDYIQSTLPKKGRLWKTISFSIDISNFSLQKLNRNLVF